MEIKAVKFRRDGFYTQPFAFGGEEGPDRFDKNIRYRGSLQNYLIDTEGDVGTAAEVAARLCGGCDGGGIVLVAAAASRRDGRRAVGGCSCTHWFPRRHGIPAAYRRGDTSSAHRHHTAGRPSFQSLRTTMLLLAALFVPMLP